MAVGSGHNAPEAVDPDPFGCTRSSRICALRCSNVATACPAHCALNSTNSGHNAGMPELETASSIHRAFNCRVPPPRTHSDADASEKETDSRLESFRRVQLVRKPADAETFGLCAAVCSEYQEQALRKRFPRRFSRRTQPLAA